MKSQKHLVLAESTHRKQGNDNLHYVDFQEQPRAGKPDNSDAFKISHDILQSVDRVRA